ncbi:hypothetical protein [Fodinibius saliphilus]|uniref:hypothetical protein n=1 Tax=Fodinibius saliphilus TaxID=1920650 RepID=UPI001109592C|nr:hypothetical protein [Fodinibius saliphilus]
MYVKSTVILSLSKDLLVTTRVVSKGLALIHEQIASRRWIRLHFVSLTMTVVDEEILRVHSLRSFPSE